MPEKTTILNAQAIHRVLTRIAHEIVERNDQGQSVVIVGVQRGGIHLADRLGALLTSTRPTGTAWPQMVLSKVPSRSAMWMPPRCTPTMTTDWP